MSVWSRTEAFGQDSAAVLGVDDPVVVLERVHDLQDRAHPPNGVVDGHCANELRCQVCVQRQLHLCIKPQQVCGFYKREWNLSTRNVDSKGTLAGAWIQMAGLNRMWSQSCLSSMMPFCRLLRYLEKASTMSRTDRVTWTLEDWEKGRVK